MPITFSTSNTDLAKVKSDLLVVTATDGPKLGDAARVVDDGQSGGLKKFLSAAGFKGKVAETVVAPVGDAVAAKSVLVVGLGKASDLDGEGLRKVGAAIARRAKDATEVSVVLGDSLGSVGEAEAAQALAEGAGLGAYQFLEHKGKGSENSVSKLRRFKLVGGGSAAKRGLDQGALIASGVTLARNLVNGPPGSVTPSELARVARRIQGVRTTVWDKARCEKEGLGGLLGVAAGSDEPPRLIRMTYSPPNPRATLAIVGKGITFDSGGINLKPTGFIETMKYDMAGAAAVIGAMSIVADLAPPVKVIGIVPTTENMPSGKATKLGDVLTIRNGKTVEVLNTDAEGRLVLSDGLSLAVEDGVDAIIDLATLTGAAHVALGDDYAALMTNNDDLAEQVRQAGERTAELTWPLPLPKSYRKQLDSDVADIKNVGAGRYGGAITAGLFLQEFVGDTPWVHLDIAGTAWRDGANGYQTKGGTGFGVRLLADLVTGFRRPKKR